MAAVVGTFTTYQAVGNREDLTDIIYDISPTETPFMSNGGRDEEVKHTFHEWQTDSLAAPAANAHPEGDDVTTYTTASATTRVGTYCQISRKDVLVSGTQRAVNPAGRKDELAYQVAKRGKELKRDMEYIALSNQATSGSDSRTTGSILAWLKTNTDFGSNGADPVYGTTPTDTRSDGDARTFTETILKSVMQTTWETGGNPSILMVGAYNKTVVSGFAGIAAQRYAAPSGPTTIIGAADVYVSDFGELSVVPNRFMRTKDALFLDPEGYGFGYLRPFKLEEMAKTGDGDKRVILVEWLLKVNNEGMHGLATDLTAAVV